MNSTSHYQPQSLRPQINDLNLRPKRCSHLRAISCFACSKQHGAQCMTTHSYSFQNVHHCGLNELVSSKPCRVQRRTIRPKPRRESPTKALGTVAKDTNSNVKYYLVTWYLVLQHVILYMGRLGSLRKVLSVKCCSDSKGAARPDGKTHFTMHPHLKRISTVFIVQSF